MDGEKNIVFEFYSRAEAFILRFNTLNTSNKLMLSDHAENYQAV